MLKVEPAVQVAVYWVEDILTSLPTNPLAAGSAYTFTRHPTTYSRQDAPLAVPYPGRYPWLDAQTVIPSPEMEAAQQSASSIPSYRD